MSTNFNGTNSATLRVSIGMPVYNGEDHVREAIESVLSQTFSDFELIICDNASTDRTEQICREFAGRDPRVRLYRNSENQGLAKNFRRAFELSQGEFFKWFAHDDILAPTYIERCIEMFEQSPPSVVLCFPQRVQVSYDGQMLRASFFRPWQATNPPYDRIGFAHLMCVPGHRFPGLVFGLARREVWAKTQLIQPVWYSDAIVVTELRLLGEFREIPEPLFLNRQHLYTPTFIQQRGTIVGGLQNYDPVKRHRTRTRAGALMTLLMARLSVVRHSSIPVYRKAIYLFYVVVGHALICAMTLWDTQSRLLRYPIEKMWESISLRLIRRSENNFLFHRVWVLLAGIRHLDPALVSLAFSSPTQETSERLLAYVTKRLQYRHDAHARQVLTDWATRRPKFDRNDADNSSSRMTTDGNERPEQWISLRDCVTSTACDSSGCGSDKHLHDVEDHANYESIM